MANWFGKGKRGLIMGIWNSHTSIGNIIGALIAGAFVNENWGLSFIMPGLMMCAVSLLIFFCLVPEPAVIGIHQPKQRSSVGGPQSDGSVSPGSNLKRITSSSRLIDSSLLTFHLTQPQYTGVVQQVNPITFAQMPD